MKLPKFFKKSYDGGEKSGVTGFWLVEWKPVFSIVLLKFNKGSRECYHSHAFNAITWWLKGKVTEHYKEGGSKDWKPSIFPKYTPRECFHKIYAKENSYAISFRGPWVDKWQEFSYKDNKTTTLTHGRREV